MKRSAGRILTTHVGSLPRPADLLEMNSSSYGARAAATGPGLAMTHGHGMACQTCLTSTKFISLPCNRFQPHF